MLPTPSNPAPAQQGFAEGLSNYLLYIADQLPNANSCDVIFSSTEMQIQVSGSTWNVAFSPTRTARDVAFAAMESFEGGTPFPVHRLDVPLAILARMISSSYTLPALRQLVVHLDLRDPNAQDVVVFQTMNNVAFTPSLQQLVVDLTCLHLPNTQPATMTALFVAAQNFRTMLTPFIRGVIPSQQAGRHINKIVLVADRNRLSPNVRTVMENSFVRYATQTAWMDSHGEYAWPVYANGVH